MPTQVIGWPQEIVDQFVNEYGEPGTELNEEEWKKALVAFGKGWNACKQEIMKIFE